MKLRVVFLMLIIGLLSTISSCKKEEEEAEQVTLPTADNDEGNGSTDGVSAPLSEEIRCKIDGVEKSFKFAGANTHHYDASYSSSPTGKLIQLAKSSTGSMLPEIFAIDIWKDLDLMNIPQTYQVTPADIEDPDVDHLVWLSYTSGAKIYLSQMPGGELTLTVTGKTNDLIEGTFSGKLITNINLTRRTNQIHAICCSDHVQFAQFRQLHLF